MTFLLYNDLSTKSFIIIALKNKKKIHHHLGCFICWNFIFSLNDNVYRIVSNQIEMFICVHIFVCGVSEITENQMNKWKFQSATREIKIIVCIRHDDDDIISVKMKKNESDSLVSWPERLFEILWYRELLQMFFFYQNPTILCHHMAVKFSLFTCPAKFLPSLSKFLLFSVWKYYAHKN